MAKPTIRFKGYTEDWEQRKLNEIADKVSEKNKNNEFSEPFTNSAEQGIISQKDYFDREIVNNENLNGYYIVRNDDFIYNPRISVTAPVGPINRNRLGRNGVMSPLYTVFRTHDIDNLYLEFYFKTTKWHRFMKLNGDSGARFDRFTISSTQFMEMPIPYPTLEEQQKIGEYFDSLDNLITLHQRKCEETKILKKYMLQKMFPQNGQKVPEIRFKGFTEDWEQRKLGDIYGSIGNAFVGTATPYYAEQGHFYLESNNVKDGQINHNSEIFINDEFYEKQKDKWLHTGDMVMVQSGHVGHAAVIPEELDNTAAHALIMFRNPKEKIEPYFLNYEYQTDKAKKKIENITTGNTIKHILASDMQEFVVDVPKYEEQKVIAGYFCNIDHLITLHQRKPYFWNKFIVIDWEQRKLGDNIVEYTEKTTENNQYPVLTSSRKGIFFQTDYYDGNQIASADNTGYNIVPYGYFTYRHMSDDEIFHFNINDIAENGIVSTLYPVFTTDENLDSRYLQYQLNYGREFARYAILQKQGGSRTYMYLNKLRNLYLTVPTAIEEQKKISEYFTNLDHLITLHQRKYEELKNIKKFMLQNMFV